MIRYNATHAVYWNTLPSILDKSGTAKRLEERQQSAKAYYDHSVQ